MADSKITALAALTTADPANDMFPVVDVSDTSMAASGTTKRISINNILACSPSATLASATITGNLTVDTTTLVVDSTNNRVGIGTASPAVTFDVAGPIRSIVSGGIPYLYLNNGTSQHSIANDSNALSISVFAAEQMRIAASGVFTWYDGAGGTRMTLNATGLGVGVSPSYKLDVAGSSAGVLRLVNISNSSTDPAAVTRLSLDSQGATWHLDNERTSGIFKITRNSTACLTIDNSGNVGIGVGTFGTSAAKVLSIATGTEPTTGPAGTVQFFTSTRSASNTIPAIFTEGSGVTNAAITNTTVTNKIAIKVNGTIYYLLATTSAA